MGMLALAEELPNVSKSLMAPLEEGVAREAEPDVRFETGPGEQAQVDWGSNARGFLERVRVHIFTMVLGYSRRIFARAYLGEGLECCLTRTREAFSHFGAPRRSCTTTRARS